MLKEQIQNIVQTVNESVSTLVASVTDAVVIPEDAASPNQFPVIEAEMARYAVSNALAQLADAVKDDAKANLTALGAMEVPADAQPGLKNHRNYSGQFCDIELTLRNPAAKVDTTKLKNELVKRGVLQLDEVNALFADCTTFNAPAKVWTVVAHG